MKAYKPPTATVNVMVRLTPAQAEGLDRLCERYKAKRAVVVRRVLEAHVRAVEEESA